MQSLEIFTKAVIDARPADLDSTAIDVPWRHVPASEGKKLRLGVLPEDPSYPLHPPVRNAISQAVAKLRAEGHILINLDPKECLIDGINDVAWGTFGLDKTSSRIVTDAGEPDIPSRQRIVDELKRLKSDYLPDLTGLSDLDKLATLTIKKAAAVEGWRRIWQNHRLDAVIGPSAQNTAVQHDLFGVPPYTCFLNVLNVSHVCLFETVSYTDPFVVSSVRDSVWKSKAGPWRRLCTKIWPSRPSLCVPLSVTYTRR